MPKFIAGILLGLFLQQATSSVLVTNVYRESTKPTGDVVFWHLPAVGGLCSADVHSSMGKALAKVESEKDNPVKVAITFDVDMGLRR